MVRVGGIEHLDPAAVPLPTGTEVTTQVDGRRVPQGVVGGVTSSNGDQYGITSADVGLASYRPDELTPRNAG